MATYHFTQGDQRPAISAYLEDAYGRAIPLPTSVSFVMRDRRSSAVKVNGAATIENLTVGDDSRVKVTYSWASTDLDSAGEFLCEWRCTFADGTQMTVPNGTFDVVRVKPKVDVA